jgi:hypothetical protein
MERAKRKTSPRKKKTRSEKLRTKSEILAALDKMEFSFPALVSAAQGLAIAHSGRKKVTLRTFHVAPQPKIRPKGHCGHSEQAQRQSGRVCRLPGREAR